MNALKKMQLEWLSSPRLVCGLMSGTSVDGVDAALAEFAVNPDGSYKLSLKGTLFRAFTAGEKQAINAIISGNAGLEEISSFNFALSQIYAETVKDLCRQMNIPVRSIDAVGMHGQTVMHIPDGRDFAGRKTASTLQLGNPSVLAQMLGVTCVGDFRSADIALGGQGAPLVPVFDYEFLADRNRDTIALNIGGISNITVMKMGAGKDEITAFDTGPGNTLIDLATKKYFNKDFDKNGSIAQQGRIIDPLLIELKQEPFIKREPPKSSGRELFNLEFLEQCLLQSSSENEAPENIIATISYFTSWCIAENIRLFANPASRIVASGGGIKNIFMMDSLGKELPQSTIITSDEVEIPSDYKEALAFAFLAFLTMAGKPGNIPSVTGAERPAILGVIALP